MPAAHGFKGDFCSELTSNARGASVTDMIVATNSPTICNEMWIILLWNRERVVLKDIDALILEVVMAISWIHAGTNPKFCANLSQWFKVSQRMHIPRCWVLLQGLGFYEDFWKLYSPYHVGSNCEMSGDRMPSRRSRSFRRSVHSHYTYPLQIYVPLALDKYPYHSSFHFTPEIARSYHRCVTVSLTSTKTKSS